jgi:predicted AAA+ superfamily ATPase
VKNNTRKNNYLFIDEVQLCNSFEKALNSLHATEKYDIYVTGSKAFLLRSDLATLFTGRTFEIQVFPFSFAEYVKYYKPKNPEASFDAYLKEGGMAGAFLYKTGNEKFRYVNEDVFSTLVIRDIVKNTRFETRFFLKN